MRLFMLILMSVIISACANSKNVSKKPKLVDYSKTAALFMPLKTGNKWVYSVNYVGNKGEMTISLTSKKDGWFIDNRGNKLKIDRRGIRDEDRYLLLFPLRQKKSWVSFISPTNKEVRTVVHVDAEVRVPAGAFKGAIVVESVTKVAKRRRLKSLHYFVKDVGLVRVDTFLEDFEHNTVQQQTTTQLKEFDIAGYKS